MNPRLMSSENIQATNDSWDGKDMHLQQVRLRELKKVFQNLFKSIFVHINYTLWWFIMNTTLVIVYIEIILSDNTLKVK